MFNVINDYPRRESTMKLGEVQPAGWAAKGKQKLERKKKLQSAKNFVAFCYLLTNHESDHCEDQQKYFWHQKCIRRIAKIFVAFVAKLYFLIRLHWIVIPFADICSVTAAQHPFLISVCNKGQHSVKLYNLWVLKSSPLNIIAKQLFSPVFSSSQ